MEPNHTLTPPLAHPEPKEPNPNPQNGKNDIQPPAEMKVEDVVALCKPSVAFLRNRQGSRSGFLVDGGLVVTNSHAVSDDTIAGLTVTFPSSAFKNEQYKVRLAYEDRVRDIAVLQLLGPPALAPLQLGSGTVAAGEDVLAISSPGASGADGGVSINSTDKGSVNNPYFYSSQYNGAKKDLRYIQHDANIRHGSSGSPLLDMHAQVIGVNLYGLDNGVKLAIPADEVGAVISKAKDRTAAEINHATATHDAYIISLNLAKSRCCLYQGSNGYAPRRRETPSSKASPPAAPTSPRGTPSRTSRRRKSRTPRARAGSRK